MNTKSKTTTVEDIFKKLLSVNAPAEEPRTTIVEIAKLLNCFTVCGNRKGLKAKTILDTMLISDQVQKSADTHKARFTALMERYNVLEKVNKETGERAYDWSDHPDSSEISEVLGLLDKVEYKIDGLNKLSDDEFLRYTLDMTDGPLRFFRKYLVREANK